VADLHLEREPTKARANMKTHGIRFDEAETACYDDYAVAF